MAGKDWRIEDLRRHAETRSGHHDPAIRLPLDGFCQILSQCKYIPPSSLDGIDVRMLWLLRIHHCHHGWERRYPGRSALHESEQPSHRAKMGFPAILRLLQPTLSG